MYYIRFNCLGGDLFHESIPSRYTEHKVISLLRKYCLSDKPIRMEMCSDPNEVFENSQFKCVNYEDPDINVGLPIFSIHGNHDDFSGKVCIFSHPLQYILFRFIGFNGVGYFTRRWFTKFIWKIQ